jgi:hypothetical protein
MPIASADRRAGTAAAGFAALLMSGWLLAGGAIAQTSPDPVNNPKIDFFAPTQADVAALLPDPMPAIPADRALKDFQASAATSNRYGIDPASVVVRDLKVIQFTLVITSPRGARNITYEAIHCERRETMLMAIAGPQGWSALKSPRWRPVPIGDTLNSHLRELDRTWCEGGTAVAPASDLPGRLQAPSRQYIN